MTDGPLTDVVSQQYERWTYPEPTLDLAAWTAHSWQWFDPSHAQPVLWPDRAPRDALDILIAGCGTNQAAVFAYTNPQSRVVGIDVSQASLDHQRYLKERHGLSNLELQLLPIEDVAYLQRDFDLIVSTGVLHHLADPVAGMRALARRLRPDGVMAVMLYARYGRLGVEMLQGAFRDLGLRQDQASLDIVRAALAAVPSDHPVAPYLAIAPDLNVDAGMVDTFLHGRDRSYTVADCLDLVASAGMDFQDWLLKSAYYPPRDEANPFYASVARLPDAQQWAVMERVNSRNACHFFLARHATGSHRSYVVDFSAPEWPDYVPDFRYRCGVAGDEIFRHDWSVALDPGDITLVRLVDGTRTIAQIWEEAGKEGHLSPTGLVESRDRAQRLFRFLWQFDFLSMRIPADPSGVSSA